jgi:aryl-alcohol dehydrogenase-like predicted oxidoreductase
LRPSRRRLLAAGAGVLLESLARYGRTAEEPLQTRRIPRSGEQIPVIGIGTAVIFDFGDDPEKYAQRRGVVQALVAAGGKLIDTAHSYGRAEERVGDIVADLGVRQKLFLATKFAYALDPKAATASLETSLRRLKTDRVDLMQAWNVGEPSFDFALLREWQRRGVCRYVGMTTSSERQYEAIGRVLARARPDFLQVNYSLGDRRAEKSLLPAAQAYGTAVLVNLPFGRNSLFRKAGGRPLPEFAADFGARTWAQFFLKFILSHPAVTAVIPGTDKPEYMLDNLQAGRGPLPDAAMRGRMVEYWDSLA